MKILTKWLRSYLPDLPVSDAQLAEDLTLRGIAVEGIYDLGAGNGSLFEMDITTNRVDAMNHYGIAREAAAIYGLALKPLDAALPDAFAVRASLSPSASKPKMPAAASPRASCATSPSPTRATGSPAPKSATYFGLLEQKQISNAVDATNFAWLAMGQPTHAFDLDKIEGGIIVRRARKGERLKTLDGIERILDPEDLVVADHVKPSALAGVMGGWDTMITPDTKNVLVEAAWFEPMAVRRTARRHGLHTDASHRFERGADFNAAPVASALVSQNPARQRRLPRRRPRRRARSRSGSPHRASQAHRARAQRSASPFSARQSTRRASPPPPSNRPHRTRLPARIPKARPRGRSRCPAGVSTRTRNRPHRRGRARLRLQPLRQHAARFRRRRQGAALGRSRIRGPPHPARCRIPRSHRQHLLLGAEAALTAPQPGVAVPLGNPLSEEAGVLRPSLVPGMLAAVAGNLHRDVSDVRLFELGTVFSGTTEKVEERPALAFAAVGDLPEQSALHPARPSNSTTSRALVEQILARFQTRVHLLRPLSRRRPASHPHGCIPIAPRASLRKASQSAGSASCIPTEAAARKLKDPVLIGELYLDRLYKLPLRKPAAREISRFQPVRRDFSLVLDRWHRLGGDRSGARRAANSRARRLARPRSLPRARLGAARVFAAARHYLPGARSHPARRGTARVFSSR